MTRAAESSPSPVAVLADEYFSSARGCDAAALATLCAALPRQEAQELFELLAHRVRRLAREAQQLREERLSWAAQTVPARQVCMLHTALHLQPRGG